MSCPTCDHTMALLTLEPKTFWCSRCGTIKSEGLVVEYQAPKLVGRCREFEQLLSLVTAGDGRCWRTLGIAESINTPENRPQ